MNTFSAIIVAFLQGCLISASYGSISHLGKEIDARDYGKISDQMALTLADIRYGFQTANLNEAPKNLAPRGRKDKIRRKAPQLVKSMESRLMPRAAECTFQPDLPYTMFTCPGETTPCPPCPEEEVTLRWCPIFPSDAPPRATRRPPNNYHVAHLSNSVAWMPARGLKRQACGPCATTVTTTLPPRSTCKKDWRTETPWPVATRRPPNNYHVAHSKEGESTAAPASRLERQCGSCLTFEPSTTAYTPKATCKQDWRTGTPWPVATRRPPNNYHVAHQKSDQSVADERQFLSYDD